MNYGLLIELKVQWKWKLKRCETGLKVMNKCVMLRMRDIRSELER